MPLDAMTTSLVGIGAGAVGVVVHAAAHYVSGGMKSSRDRTVTALFFALISGFLMPWVWVFGSPLLTATLAFPPLFTGMLWGALVWGTFILPSHIAHLVWNEEEVNAAASELLAWLAQAVIGGALCGAVLVP